MAVVVKVVMEEIRKGWHGEEKRRYMKKVELRKTD